MAQQNTNTTNQLAVRRYQVVQATSTLQSSAYAGYSIDDDDDGDAVVRACDHQSLHYTDATKPLQTDIWSPGTNRRFCAQTPRHGENVASPHYLPPVLMYFPQFTRVPKRASSSFSSVFPTNAFVSATANQRVSVRPTNTYLAYVKDRIRALTTSQQIAPASLSVIQGADEAITMLYEDLQSPSSQPHYYRYGNTNCYVYHGSSLVLTAPSAGADPVVVVVITDGDVTLPPAPDFARVGYVIFCQGILSASQSGAPSLNTPSHRVCTCAGAYDGSMGALAIPNGSQPSHTLVCFQNAAYVPLTPYTPPVTATYEQGEQFFMRSNFEVSTEPGTWSNYTSVDGSVISFKRWTSSEVQSDLNEETREMIALIMKRQYGMDSYRIFPSCSGESNEFFGDSESAPSPFRDHIIEFTLGCLKCYTYLVVEPEQGCQSMEANWLIDTAPFVFENYACKFFESDAAPMIETYRLSRTIFIPSQVQGYFMTLRESDSYEGTYGSRLNGIPFVVGFSEGSYSIEKRDVVADAGSSNSVEIPGCGSSTNPEDISTCMAPFSGTVGGADFYYSYSNPDEDCDDRNEERAPLENIKPEVGVTIFSKFRRVDIMPPASSVDAYLRCAYMTNTRYLPIGMKLKKMSSSPGYVCDVDGVLVVRSKDPYRNNTVDVTVQYDEMTGFSRPEMNIAKFYETLNDRPVVFYCDNEEARVLWHDQIFTVQLGSTPVVINGISYLYMLNEGERVFTTASGSWFTSLPSEIETCTRSVRIRVTFGDMVCSEDMRLPQVSDPSDLTVPSFLNFHRRLPNGKVMSNIPFVRIAPGQHIADVKLRGKDAEDLFVNNGWDLSDPTCGIATRSYYEPRTIRCDNLVIDGVTKLAVIDNVAYTKLFPGTTGIRLEEDLVTPCDTPHFSIGEKGEVSGDMLPFRAAGQLYIRDTSIPPTRRVVSVPFDTVGVHLGQLSVEDQLALSRTPHFALSSDSTGFTIHRKTRSNPVIVTETVTIKGVVECPRISSTHVQTGLTHAYLDVVAADGTMLSGNLPREIDDILYIAAPSPYMDIQAGEGVASSNPQPIADSVHVDVFNDDIAPDVVSVPRSSTGALPPGVSEVFVKGVFRFVFSVTGESTVFTVRIRGVGWRQYTVTGPASE